MNTDTATARDAQPVLGDLAKCQGCGCHMTIAGGDVDHAPRYVCLNVQGTDGSRCDLPEIECDLPEIETGRLDQLVIDHLVSRVLTDDLLQEVIAQVRLDAAQRALEQQRHLGVVQDELHRLKRERTKLASEVEEGGTSYPEVSDQLNRMGESWHSIKDETQQAERSLEGYRYVADDEGRVASYARSADTYLRGINAATTRSLLEMIVDEILVSTDFVTITYRTPLATDGGADHTQTVIPY